MPRVAVLLAAVLLATPTAAAWEATLVSRPSAVSLAESLLLAGAIQATAPEGGTFGAPGAQRLLFDAPVDVRWCADQGGEPAASASCPGPQDTTGARFYIHGGGLVALAPAGAVTLAAPASAAALAGPNATLAGEPLGASIVVGGDAVVRAEGNALVVRPILPNASIELRGNEGFRTYNGTGYTLFVTGAFGETTLEARGAFLAADPLEVSLARAGLADVESRLSVEELYVTLKEIQPPELADRRAAISGAFGPFQLVPALIDGAAAARANLTLNDAPREGLTFVRLADARFAHEAGVWTGAGNATYLVEGETLATAPGDAARLPIVLPLVLVALAIAARALTRREPLARKARWIAGAIATAAIVALVLLAAARLAPLLGVSPVADASELSLRSRVQLLLLDVGIVAVAALAVGLPVESLARSAFAWRGRARAIVLPKLAGLVAAALFVIISTAALLSFVARFIRL